MARRQPSGKRLQGLGHKGQTERLGEPPDSLAKSVGDQAQPKAGLPQGIEPLGHARGTLLAAVAFQRAVGVQEQAFQAQPTKPLGSKLQDAGNAVVRGQKAEHGGNSKSNSFAIRFLRINTVSEISLSSFSGSSISYQKS